MSKLLMPSVDVNHFGQFITMQGLTQKEAEKYARLFTDEVIASKKCFNTSKTEKLDINFFHGVIPDDGLTDEFVAAIEKQFLKSNVPGIRGYRVLFIGDDVIGIGTTILYNPNRAALNFTDPDTMAQLVSLKDGFDSSKPVSVADADVIGNVDIGDPAPVSSPPYCMPTEPAKKFVIDAAIATQTEPKQTEQQPKKNWLARILGL